MCYLRRFEQDQLSGPVSADTPLGQEIHDLRSRPPCPKLPGLASSRITTSRVRKDSRRLLIVVQLAPLLRRVGTCDQKRPEAMPSVSRRTFASPTCVRVSGDGAVRLGDEGLQHGEVDLVEIGDV
jgi:hypothetical protein